LIIYHVMGSAAAEASGPSHSVPALVAAQRACKEESWLWSVEADGAAIAERPYHCTFRRDRSLFNPAQSSRGLARALDSKARPGVVFHSHGLWLMPNVAPAFAASSRGAVFGLSPRGMLAPEALAYSPTKKRLFWALAQRRALTRAAFLHATAESEYLEIRSRRLDNPVAVIPNGIEIPKVQRRRGPARERTVLTLGRLHPKKNLEALLVAWSRVEARFPDWRLRIVGPDEGGYRTTLLSLSAKLQLQRVSIEEPLYGAEKLAAYASADLFVLCSLNENFGMTVAEALAAGTPVLVTKGSPWAEVERARSGWWVDQSLDGLAAGLERALQAPAEHLEPMGARGRAWMQAEFSWAAVARDMLSVYAWALGRGDRPPFVRADEGRGA
jgi:glycosyltransferase involved in cell wall biosynthesis